MSRAHRLWGWTVAGLSSVRVRATAAATLVVALALGVAALILVLALSGTLQDSADAEAARKATAAVGYSDTLHLTASKMQPYGDFAKVRSATPAGATDATPKAMRLVEGKGGEVRLSSEEPLPVVDPDLMVAKKTAAAAGWADPGEYAIAAVEVTTEGGPAVLMSRVSLDGVRQALQTLYQTLVPGVPALLLVVAGMTWLSVGRALGPVAAIRTKVADITARDLHQRVPVPQSKDEIAALATTVNGTLDRLETAVERHKRFVADAAHELRSPIATLRARLELAEPSELTAEALADVERLQSLAADLLMLAKLDAGEPLRTTELDLGQVAAEAALRARRREEVRVELDVEPDVVLTGSSAHLDRLVTNLADNAVRHAASTVRVRVAAEDGEAVLEVRDDGPGIPPDQREAVFGRFTRLDEARARDAGGAGLGLPIARDIALLHKGSLGYGDSGFVARFPLRET
ncbi:HAMP domain-containing protein [Nonomuraea sp. MG754425]|uniref:sensor histidine kinase n=1 Tax=Nonomuraea sp. MG754425 TaxID=2570319 RepID=UPI001F3D6C91|nr:ATP-binding protein [Nonomuraea sp. MG754425]MCF6471929.1 HAMP domain-containing protein [Nonomuraea sp. MG754425]